MREAWIVLLASTWVALLSAGVASARTKAPFDVCEAPEGKPTGYADGYVVRGGSPTLSTSGSVRVETTEGTHARNASTEPTTRLVDGDEDDGLLGVEREGAVRNPNVTFEDRIEVIRYDEDGEPIG